MTFMYPLGLLGLLGIPVIILIYILQNKYTEQTVNSTYIWKLSDKFLKRRNPLSGITGLISMILQILLVAAISLAIARPIFTLPGAAYDYCFVLDASGSMTMIEDEEEGLTRFDLAKEEIAEIIDDAAEGSSYTLICVSHETVNAFTSVRDKETATELLGRVKPHHTTAAYNELLSTAQGVFDENTSTKLYLITDKGYAKHDNIEIVDVGDENKANYAILDAEYSHLGGTLTVDAKLASYDSKPATLKLNLYVNGVLATTLADQAVKEGEEITVTVSAPCEELSEFTLELENADGYELDNRLTTYNTKSDKSYSVLIVSETGFFFEAVIDALVDSRIDVVDPDEYESVEDTYGLYIFDSCQPTTLPDAAVWLINADMSVENAGFGIRGKVELQGGGVLEKSNSTSTEVRHLLRGISGNDVYITNYVKYSGMYLDFHTLYTYDSNPIIFAGANGLGNRQVVFGFDLHESDFALTTDFVILMRNMLEYSFPDVIDSTNFTVGEEAVVNVIKNATNLKAVSPSGEDIYIETNGATAALPLTEVGTYSVSVTLGGEETVYKLYAGADPAESQPALDGEDFSLSGEATDGQIDGTYDPLVLLFILIAVLFIADWGLYLYEKYQLRYSLSAAAGDSRGAADPDPVFHCQKQR